eukprot:gene7704-7887_t
MADAAAAAVGADGWANSKFGASGWTPGRRDGRRDFEQDAGMPKGRLKELIDETPAIECRLNPQYIPGEDIPEDELKVLRLGRGWGRPRRADD